ncbi:MAG: family containing protein [Candidatus Solibacter sp.]|nr:family containing protein [Candidatus Solibacter sp.]
MGLASRYTSLMTRRLLGLFVLLAGFAFAQNRVYELRTYTCNEGKLETLKTRFRDHTIEIFKRHGMESVGYWVPQDGEKSKTTLIYIISHASREAAKANWAAFSSDPEWRKVAAESELNGKIVNHVDSVFMDPTDFSKLK